MPSRTTDLVEDAKQPRYCLSCHRGQQIL